MFETQRAAIDNHIKDFSWRPDIWFDDDYLELIYEWIDTDRNKYAVLQIDSTDTYIYCFLINGEFESGAMPCPTYDIFPDDLRDYLNGN